MDNLVLTTVVRALDQGLRGAVLDELSQDAPDRFRLRWDRGGRTLSTVLSMRPEAPWIGRPTSRAERRLAPRGRFAAQLRRDFRGARVTSVGKPTSDRWVEWCFADGRRWIVELAMHGANLILLDARGRIVAALRRPRSSSERLKPGEPYLPPKRPASLPDPFAMSAEEIDAMLGLRAADGEPQVEALRRRLFGIGLPAARLICEESARSGHSAGTVLVERLQALSAGCVDPVIETDGAAAAGRTLNDTQAALWPWQPRRSPGPGRVWWRGRDAAATAGMWYGMREQHHESDLRRRTLGRIVRREASRCDQAARRCAADLRGFEDPERYRRWAEALLAGLSHAERLGDAVRVPNPEDPESGDYVFPAEPRLSLPRVAERLFDRHRRALRGLRRARERLKQLTARGRELSALERLAADGAPEAELFAAMRPLRLPVALEPATRRGREASRLTAPRLEGVRIYYASTGEMILAGKGARANHRLTFRLAAPHDFWLHASGVPGAHVILRNDSRAADPGPALAEAAAVAARYSEAAGEARVDVRWTQRKNVKKPRGAAPGTVVLKRFATVRVRPGLPSETGSKPTIVARSRKT